MARKTLLERLETYDTSKALAYWKKSNYNAKTLLKQRVLNIITQEHSYFITFTIAPEHYNYKKDTYFRKTKEALSQASLYIANEDYGTDNGRLHIHALVSFPFRYDYTQKNHSLQQVWKYGNIQFETIHTPNDDAITNYMSKLSAHATKETARKIIYSRGFIQ